MIEIDSFTDEQKTFLARIVDDLNGPTVASDLLAIIENLLYTLDPDWQDSPIGDISDAKADIQVCLAALAYHRVKHIAAAYEP